MSSISLHKRFNLQVTLTTTFIILEPRFPQGQNAGLSRKLARPPKTHDPHGGFTLNRDDERDPPHRIRVICLYDSTERVKGGLVFD